MTFPVTPILSTFPTDGGPPPPGGSFVNGPTTLYATFGGMEVSGGLCVPNGTGGTTGITLWDAVFGPDCESYAEIAQIETDDFFILYVRSSDSGEDCYMVMGLCADGENFAVALFSFNTVGGTTTLWTGNVALYAGDWVGMEAIGRRLCFYIKRSGATDFQVQATYVDHSSSAHIGSGHIGFGAIAD